ncbi:uncharacterized protein LOC130636781 [Hydractinia symbiolongicarpus]|uniref:uncharacterized protein LOC130636781 n=1 Tax=Hydractinia symbiolongicarpus TaxID=13093 RepID=UPI00254F8CC7|nr:uncharacterized protein LOC130636781 [Hydractinia symbiolongicarpus]
MEEIATEYEKKKLQGFLRDILRIGCTKGFRYFSMYLRGREELLLKVQNEQLPCNPSDLEFDQEVVTDVSNDDIDEEEEEEDKQSSSFPEKPLPRAYDSMMLSKSTQRSISGFHFLDIGLPPASPCEADSLNAETHSTLFLLAAYGRYKSPYVWVRSNHNRLIRFTENYTSNDEVYQIQDSPLKLKSTSEWSHKDVKIWDILAEIVRINVLPCPRNPFAVEHSYFDELSPHDGLLATGAMVQLLQRILLHGDHSYHTSVAEDLNEITRKHFKILSSLVTQPVART